MVNENLEKLFEVAQELTGNEAPMGKDKVETCAENVRTLTEDLVQQEVPTESLEMVSIQDDPCFKGAIINAVLTDYGQVITDEFELDASKLQNFLTDLIFGNQPDEIFSTECLESILRFTKFILREAVSAESWDGSDIFINTWGRFSHKIEILKIKQAKVS